MPFGIIGRTGPGMRQVVGFGDRSTGRGTFGGEFGARHCNHGDFTAYVCDSAATRPSSQITLDRLVALYQQWRSDEESVVPGGRFVQCGFFVFSDSLYTHIYPTIETERERGGRFQLPRKCTKMNRLKR